MPDVAIDSGERPGLARSATIAVASQFAMMLLAGVAGILAARLLGPEGKGLVAVLMVVAWMISTLATGGLELWSSRALGQGDALATVTRVVRRHLTWVVPTLVVGGGLATMVLVSTDTLRGTEAVATVALVLGAALALLEVGFALGRHQLRRYAASNVGWALVHLVGVAFLLVIDRPSVALVIAVVALGRWAAWLGLLVARLRDGVPPAAADAGSLSDRYRAALRFGRRGAVGELLEFAIARTDVLLVAAFLDLEHAGLYVTAATLTELLWVAPNAIADVLVPHAASPDADARRSAQAIRVSVMLLAAGAALVAVTAFVTIPAIFGSRFEDAVPAVAPLAAAAVVLGAWKLVCADLIAADRPGVRVSSGTIGLVTMLAVDLALIPAFGIVGAGFGALVGYVIATGFALRHWTAIRGTRARDALLPSRADVAVVLATLQARTRRPSAAIERGPA